MPIVERAETYAKVIRGMAAGQNLYQMLHADINLPFNDVINAAERLKAEDFVREVPGSRSNGVVKYQVTGTGQIFLAIISSSIK